MNKKHPYLIVGCSYQISKSVEYIYSSASGPNTVFLNIWICLLPESDIVQVTYCNVFRGSWEHWQGIYILPNFFRHTVA